MYDILNWLDYNRRTWELVQEHDGYGVIVATRPYQRL
jgi:hypothetical protein